MHQKYDSQNFNKWQRDTHITIEKIFGRNSRNARDFSNIIYSPLIYYANTPDHVFQESYIDGLRSAQTILQSMIDEIKEYWDENVVSNQIDPIPTKIKTTNIFIIHGHDHSTKNILARFITKLGLNPIILHEKANLGRTIIEKFEDHAINVSYAIALLTPDDYGAAKGRAALHDRARQNVVFEFGYFIGKLGREHVCGITKGDIEIPTDLSGVIYIRLDDRGAWKAEVVKELRGVGINIDANLTF